MRNAHDIELWLERFPGLQRMSPAHLQVARGTVQFPVLEPADIAYHQDWACPNYVMCVDGLTRVFRLSETGREVLVYRVGAGGTCLLTTQCLLSGGTFPAESVAEERTTLAALPASTFHQLMRDSDEFRTLVLDDYAKLLGALFSLVDDLAFTNLEQKLARRLLADAGIDGAVIKTHQQLASDLGTVREVVSRQLGLWERSGLISLERGAIHILDRAHLAML